MNIFASKEAFESCNFVSSIAIKPDKVTLGLGTLRAAPVLLFLRAQSARSSTILNGNKLFLRCPHYKDRGFGTR